MHLFPFKIPGFSVLFRMVLLLKCLDSHKFLSKIFIFLRLFLIHLKFGFVHDKSIFLMSDICSGTYLSTYASSIHFPQSEEYFSFLIIVPIIFWFIFLIVEDIFKINIWEDFYRFFQPEFIATRAFWLGKNCKDSKHTSCTFRVYDIMDLKNIF